MAFSHCWAWIEVLENQFLRKIGSSVEEPFSNRFEESRDLRVAQQLVCKFHPVRPCLHGMCEIGHSYAGVYFWTVMWGMVNNWGRLWKGGPHVTTVDGEGTQVGGAVFITPQNNITIINHIALVLIKNHHASRITQWAYPHQGCNGKVRDNMPHQS
jgi:hypothetical protein